MRTFFPLYVLAALVLSCSPAYPKNVPTGSWKYRLTVNGSPIGTSLASCAFKDGKYTVTTEMAVDTGHVKNRVTQTIVETADFKPVSLESVSVMESNGKEMKAVTRARFKDQVVQMEVDGRKAEYTIARPFVLEGNYYLGELIKNEFKKGTVVRAWVYEPSIDYEQATLMIIKVLGREKITVGGRERELIRVGWAIENLKNIDMYLDDSGVMVKATIIMLNNRLELELE